MPNVFGESVFYRVVLGNGRRADGFSGALPILNGAPFSFVLVNLVESVLSTLEASVAGFQRSEKVLRGAHFTDCWFDGGSGSMAKRKGAQTSEGLPGTKSAILQMAILRRTFGAAFSTTEQEPLRSDEVPVGWTETSTSPP
ncbi:hypothetical protein ZHAS_00019521 [Anopheles sinensis]|uniref:Uncharacterized protein n=1 Tax=Anopheles sinensis TaxID=74873 RepID=A0A084WMC0_ANOSI|nr:hypothetical protein ZHAS_00019521 [Anopheles sinensis]